MADETTTAAREISNASQQQRTASAEVVGAMSEVAVRALGRIGEPSVAPALLDTLEGARAVPAQTVVGALLRIGTAAAPAIASRSATLTLMRATLSLCAATAAEVTMFRLPKPKLPGR